MRRKYYKKEKSSEDIPRLVLILIVLLILIPAVRYFITGTVIPTIIFIAAFYGIYRLAKVMIKNNERGKENMDQKIFKTEIIKENTRVENENTPKTYNHTDYMVKKFNHVDNVGIVSEFNEVLLRSLEWKRFETLCKELICLLDEKLDARETNFGADGGIDIKVYDKKSNELVGIVQCKAWNTYTVKIDSLREFLGVMTKEKVKNGAFITTSKYTKDAEEFAKETNIKLISGKKLIDILNSLPEKKLNDLIQKTFEGDYWTPTCPKCGIKMKIRETAKPFWGCTKYPRCRHTFPIKTAEVID